MVDEFVLAEGEGRAGLTGIGAEPGLLAENGSGLFPEAEVVALTVAIETLLPGDVLALPLEILRGDGSGGVVGKIQEGAKFAEDAPRRETIAVHPARGTKRGIHLIA